MALIYQNRQDNREYINQKKGVENPNYGYWYGKAVTLGTKDTNDIADLVQRNCSMKKSDVKAVIEELIEVIHDQLCNSYAVKLDGLGIFKAGIKTTGTKQLDEWTAAKNIVSAHVNFQPSVTVDGATGSHVSSLLHDIKYQEQEMYSVD